MAQYESDEMISPIFRVASARHAPTLMLALMKWTEPSVNRKLTPPGCMLQ